MVVTNRILFQIPSKRHRNVRRPVIVFFHAGGFYSVSGVSSIYGPQYFMDQDIVLVTANYRLGSLGITQKILFIEIVLNDALLQDFDQNYITVWPISFCYERNTDNSKRISRNFRQYFFGEKAIGNETFSSIANLYSDGIIGFAVNRGVKLLSERNTESVYYYRFSY